MKKVFTVLLISFLIVLISSCSSDDYKEIKIEMSENTKSVIDDMGFDNKYVLTEEGWPEYRENYLNRNNGHLPQVTYTVDDEGNKVQQEYKTKYSDTWEDFEYVSSFTPNDDSYDFVIVYIHGGAYINAATASHSKYCDNLSFMNHALVVVPNYELAPEGTYDKAYALLDEVYNKLSNLNKPIVIAGDSAGGGLALGYVLTLKERNYILPNKVLVSSPWVDIKTSNPDIKECRQYDVMLDDYGLKEAGKWWAGNTSLDDYRLSPINGDFEGFPETLLFASTHEIFYPDLQLLKEKLISSNVKLTYVELQGFTHVSNILTYFDEYDQMLEIVKKFIQQ